MPPPPPPRSAENGEGAEASPTKGGPPPQADNTSGRSPPAYTPADKEKKREEDRQKDDILDAKLNGESKIAREYVMSMGILMFYTMYRMMYRIQRVFQNSIILDEINLTDSVEDSYEDDLTYNQLFLCGYIFIFCALCLNMYYYVFLGEGQVGGSLGIIIDYLNCRDQTKKIFYWIIAGLYGLGIILYISGFLKNMDILYGDVDEDDLSDDALDALFGQKTILWACVWCYPFYCSIVCAQHLFPQFCLNLFESRVCLWSLVICIGSFIYSLFLTSENFYENSFYYVYSISGNDDIQDAEEGNFVFARLMIWFTFLAWLGLTIYSGLGMYKILIKKEESEANTRNVFKIYILLGITLFILMILVSISSGLALGWLTIAAGIDFPPTQLWIGAIVVLTDIIC